MEQPLVSIVVPIYNVEKYLNRCIESILNQTYGDLEVVLVDDGSFDMCPMMCDKWAEKDCRVKVIHKANAGLGMARNTGIDHAHGKYIFFFDSDDYVADTIVEKCVESAEKYQSDVVIYGRNDVYENGQIISKDITPGEEVYVGESIHTELLPGMFTYKRGFGVSAWGKMYNLNTLKRMNKRFVSEREIISEDAYFAIDFFSEISVATVLYENLYFYFKRSNSLSRIYKQDRQDKNNIFLLRSVDLIKYRRLPDVVLTYLTARYQMYSIASMKQIITSDLSFNYKRKELRKIYTDNTLRNTLERRVLKLHNKALYIFYIFLKRKCYCVCDLLLWMTVKREE